MRTLIQRLQAGTSGLGIEFMRAPPELAMPGFGAAIATPGGDMTGGAGAGAGGDDDSSQQSKLIGVDDDDDDSDPELANALKLFNGDDDDDDQFDDTLPADDSSMDDVPPERIQAMQTDIANTIKAMQFPEIPEDFDINDRTQLRALMTKGLQTAVQQNLNVVFKPVQLALGQMAAKIQSTMDAKIAASNSSSQARNVLHELVPEATMPEYRGLVNGMVEQLKAKGVKADVRAKTIRKLLNQMNINVKPENSQRRSASRGGKQSDGGATSGTAALDKFFGQMPKFK